MKQLFIVLTVMLFASFKSYGQNDSAETFNQYAYMQILGQSLNSFHYEHAVIYTPYFRMNAHFGLGLDEYADDETPGSAPVYSMFTGLVFLAGPRRISAEIDFTPTTYFHKSTSVVNLNGWFGLRYNFMKEGTSFFMSLGYSPMLYHSYSDSYEYAGGYNFGCKLGVNF